MNKMQKKPLQIFNNIEWDFFSIYKYYYAGIKLQSDEIKSIFNSRCSIKNAYCKMDDCDKQMYIHKMYVHKTNYYRRVLLLKRSEIIRISVYMRSGYILLPYLIYTVNNLIKVRLVICKYIGKKDKRKKEKEISKMLKEEYNYYN